MQPGINWGHMIMTDEQIVQFWGQDALVRWRPDVLAMTELPDEAKEFLARVGLPRGVDWTMRFDLEMERPRWLKEHPGYCIIGHDDVAAICLDENDGRVVSIEPGGRKRFMNSNVKLFGEFLALYQQYRLRARKLDDEAVKSVITEVEQQMTARDSASFSGTECWWPIILEQMKAGLL